MRSQHFPSDRGRAAQRAVAAALGGLGVVALAGLLRAAGVENVFAACRSVGLGVVVIAAAPAVGLFLHTLAWRCLVPPGLRPGVCAAFRTFVAAQAGNDLGFGFLGEPLKVTALPRTHRDVAVSVVALDNLTSAVALGVFFAGLGAVAAAPVTPCFAGSSVSLLLGGLFGVVVVGILASRRVRGRLVPILRTCRALLRERPKHAAIAAVLHFSGKLWVVAEMAIASELLGTATLHGAVVLGLACATAAAVGSPVPGQVGVVEGALVAAAGSAGLGPTAALAIGLLRRFRSTLWLALGGLFALERLRSRDPDVALSPAPP